MDYRKFLDSFEAYSWELSNKEISKITGIDINKINDLTQILHHIIQNMF